MTATSSSEDIRTGRNRLAATVTLGHAVKHLYNSGLRSLILPEIKLDLNLSGAQFGALATSREFTAWTITMFAGYLGDRYINRSGLMVGLSIALIGVGYYLISLPDTFWPLFATMFVAGLGPSLFHPPAIGELSRRFPDRRGFAISLHGTGGIAGEVLGPLVVAGLLTLMSWRGVLQAGLLPALAVAFTLWAVMNALRRNDTPNVSARAYFTAFGELIRNGPLVLLVSVSAVRIIGESAVSNFLPVFLREDLEFSPTRVAVYLSLAQVAGLGAQPAMGYLSDRFGRKTVLLPGLTTVGLLALAMGFTEHAFLLGLLVIAKGAFSFSLHHIFIAGGIDASKGQSQSTVVAFIYGSGAIGTFSPYLAGRLVDRFSTQTAFLFGGSISLLAAVIMAFAKSPSRRSSDAH